MSEPPTPGSETPEATPKRVGQRELDRTLVTGLAWTGAAKWGTQMFTWAATLLVARLLTPEDYGLVGMATIFLGLVEMVTEFGISTAVVKMRELTRSQIGQLSSVALALGFVGFLATLAAAKPLGIFFDADRLPPVIMVTGTTFMLNSLRSVPEALLRRDMRFRLIALIEGVRALGTGIAALTLAFAGLGYWALVLANIVGVTLGTTLVLVNRRHKLIVPRLGDIREALTLSGDVLGARMAWYAYANADFLVVGKMLGQAALGAYSIGWTLATIPINKITVLVGKVTPPVFSAVQDQPKELRRYLLLLTEMMAIVAFPLTVGLGLVSHDFVLVVLDEKWLPAVGPLRLLAFYATLRTIQPLIPQLLIIIGESRFSMTISVIAAVLLPVGFYFGSAYGTVGVAAVWVALDPAIQLFALRKLGSRIGMSVWDYLRAMRPALVGCLAMTVTVVGVQSISSTLPPIGRLTLQVATGAVVYIGVMFAVFRARLDLLKRAAKMLRSPG